MEHARTTPELSLGVIAFSQRQQDRILDELEILRRRDKGCEEFFGKEHTESFFVKEPGERCRATSRDVIVLSVGYGPDDTGRVMMRVRTAQPAGRWRRRLNVAVTRGALDNHGGREHDRARRGFVRAPGADAARRC